MDPLPADTVVQVGFKANGFYNTNLQCKLLVDGVQYGTSWGKGLYDSFNTRKSVTLKNSSSKFSVKCNDGM